mmetsp:Transcript_1237/g.3787  ORF Transcript_1237/g.3787 Transcript_1237/m.3787 type:complete len:320 (-) Transcript_1237:605-1564(-)
MMNLTRELRSGEAASSASFEKYCSTSGTAFGVSPRSLAQSDRISHAHSMQFSWTPSSPPSSCCTQTSTIFWLITPRMNRFPMSLTLPSILLLALEFSSSLSSASSLLRPCREPSNSSWHVFSSTRLKVMGLVSPPLGGNSGSSLLSLRHSSALSEQNMGSATAFSKSMVMLPARTSAVVMLSTSLVKSFSKFSGVSLLRSPLTCLRMRSLSLAARAGAQALRPTSEALTILDESLVPAPGATRPWEAAAEAAGLAPCLPAESAAFAPWPCLPWLQLPWAPCEDPPAPGLALVGAGCLHWSATPALPPASSSLFECIAAI